MCNVQVVSLEIYARSPSLKKILYANKEFHCVCLPTLAWKHYHIHPHEEGSREQSLRRGSPCRFLVVAVCSDATIWSMYVQDLIPLSSCFGTQQHIRAHTDSATRGPSKP